MALLVRAVTAIKASFGGTYPEKALQFCGLEMSGFCDNISVLFRYKGARGFQFNRKSVSQFGKYPLQNSGENIPC